MVKKRCKKCFSKIIFHTLALVLVNNFEEHIPMENIKSATVETKESLSAGKMLLVGVFAFAFKNKTKYLKITYTNDIQEEANALFEEQFSDSIAQKIMNKRYNLIKSKTLVDSGPASTVSK